MFQWKRWPCNTLCSNAFLLKCYTEINFIWKHHFFSSNITQMFKLMQWHAPFSQQWNAWTFSWRIFLKETINKKIFFGKGEQSTKRYFLAKSQGNNYLKDFFCKREQSSKRYFLAKSQETIIKINIFWQRKTDMAVIDEMQKSPIEKRKRNLKTISLHSRGARVISNFLAQFREEKEKPEFLSPVSRGEREI